MRKGSIIILLLTGTLVATAASPPGAAGVSDAVERLLLDLQLVPLDGQAPPPFALETLQGNRLSLADHRGRVVLLYFWASW